MAMQQWDAIVIGSGIGGLAAAAALADAGKRVLVLERHAQAGGLTQTFERHGFRFNVGVHYLGGFGEGQLNRRLFDRLSGGRIRFAPIPGVYDRLHFPDLSLDFAPPPAALRATLKNAFPQEAAGIDKYFGALADGARALGKVFTIRSAPWPIATPVAWANRQAIERWVGRTTWEVVCDCTTDERLRAVLTAQWGDYGSRPLDGSYAAHALVMQHYLDGAWYPVGGSGVFAQELGKTIEAAGGAIRTRAEVAAIRVQDRLVAGVTLANGEAIDCARVISDIGLHNTLRRLPSAEVDYHWMSDGYDMQPSMGYVGLYLGLEGDIAAHGADAANRWFFTDWDINTLWRDPFDEPRAPALFVSFPSLRDPAHEPGPARRHTAEVVALVDWSAFAQWDRSDPTGGLRPETAADRESYCAFKDMLHRNLRAQFDAHFPGLAPLVKMSEVSTPISVAHYTGAEHGAMYGLETTPRRFLTPALRPRTPIRGLYLAGQDAGMPGVTGAFFGGLMAAASCEPRLWSLLR